MAVAPGAKNWSLGWVVMTGWARASEKARHPRQTLTTILLRGLMFIKCLCALQCDVLNRLGPKVFQVILRLVHASRCSGEGELVNRGSTSLKNRRRLNEPGLRQLELHHLHDGEGTAARALGQGILQYSIQPVIGQAYSEPAVIVSAPIVPAPFTLANIPVPLMNS